MKSETKARGRILQLTCCALAALWIGCSGDEIKLGGPMAGASSMVNVSGSGGAGSASGAGGASGDQAGASGTTDTGGADGGPSSSDPDASDELPLLGSKRGGHIWYELCSDPSVPNDRELPPDPRTLVQPGVNFGKEVHFNAPWIDCLSDAKPEDAAPKTCGEYRERYARGKEMMEGGRLSFFAGSYHDGLLQSNAEDHNLLWLRWGFTERPANFDELVAERWGIPLGDERNPYPLPGEDPNETDGGSGQLPVAISHLRDADGRWTGRLGLNCSWCHSSRVGDPSDGEGLGFVYGSGNSLVDIGAAFGDIAPGFPLAANKVRGSGSILLYPAIAALDLDRAGHFNESLVSAPSGGSTDFPTWWNTGHRTRKFQDGSYAMDDTRPVMGFFLPILSEAHLMDIEAGREWIEERDQDLRLWIEALKSPAYPGPVDEELASEGAWLFHEKDLWDADLQNPVPRPDAGNGSCASCHGVYSPRYAHDPFFLDTPELEGIAANIVRHSIIGTDRARADSLNEGLEQTLKYGWWAYGTAEEPGVCFEKVVEGGGYLAPPLYGIWASAPYFHNASVPNVWAVLDPSARPEIWERKSKPNTSGELAVMGYDTSLERAYDHERLGWKYDEHACQELLPRPAFDCTPGTAEASPAGALWFSWNLEQPPLTPAELQERKIYNTHAYSQGNQGHEFTSVLTDAERKALIEYLKTL